MVDLSVDPTQAPVQSLTLASWRAAPSLGSRLSFEIVGLAIRISQPRSQALPAFLLHASCSFDVGQVSMRLLELEMHTVSCRKRALRMPTLG